MQMGKIVNSFEVKGIMVNLIKPKQNTDDVQSKKQLAKYLYKLFEMGKSK